MIARFYSAAETHANQSGCDTPAGAASPEGSVTTSAISYRTLPSPRTTPDEAATESRSLFRITAISVTFGDRSSGECPTEIATGRAAGYRMSESEKYRVASLQEIPSDTGLEVTAGGRVIALFNVDGQVHAIDGICAHAGGPIAKGVLNGQTITCPWHGWQYDVTTGTHCLTPAICQHSFEVTVEGEDVVVTIPST
jgi:nitrite reductase (NADH) small subunit